ncbi:MAG: hypothetical protein KJ609_19355 [Gammaproteobacteria bacterium]|nr:hypothetical protein [Gammaproteobacteria bacterium]MBU2240553.1 hypothetical protein [Gammaproteobacteria bacterium]MBU2320709.1 hypothetical protein [Gammaproteobacteria bacterium]MBU2415052.1 hypothetical protein [Gammaproteobacteria bacterium]
MTPPANSLNEQNKKYAQPEFTVASLTEQLQGCSPLQVSKKLINIELFDQQASVDILLSIHNDLEKQDNVMGNLIEPIFFNIIDSTIHHPKLKKYFKIGGKDTEDKKNDDPGTSLGITPSRIIKELKNFHYEQLESERSDKPLRSPEEELLYQSKHRYNEFNFRDDGKNGAMNQYREKTAKKHGHKNYCEVSNRVVTKKSKNVSTAVDVDHIIPGKSAIGGLASIPLSDLQRKQILNKESNFAMMESSDNRSKGDSSGTQYILNQKKQNSRNSRQKGKSYSTTDKAKVVARDVNALASIAGEAAVVGASNQVKSKAIGDLIILAIKPLYFEITDIVRNGVKYGVDGDSFSSALKERFNRVIIFYKTQIFPFIKETLKGFFDNIVTNFFTALGGIIISLLTKSLEIIVKGFKSIVEAIRIAFSNDSKYTPSKKGDAILKLLSTTIVTLVIEHFNDQIMVFLKDTPFDFLSDIATIILSGIASTFVVYFLDRIDLFSAKKEIQTQKVKEIFEMRIVQIKENTDAFEAASIEKLAQDRLQFIAIAEQIDKNVTENKNVNASVYDMADYLQVDLKIKTTDDFISMLEGNTQLAI